MSTMHSSPGVSAQTLESISTPDRVESRLGTLEYDDGAANRDIYFGPTAPDGQTSNRMLRLYNPLQPFFDESWRPSEIEPLD